MLIAGTCHYVTPAAFAANSVCLLVVTTKDYNIPLAGWSLAMIDFLLWSGLIKTKATVFVKGEAEYSGVLEQWIGLDSTTVAAAE